MRAPTATFDKTSVRDRMAALRRHLGTDEQNVLTLRIDRELPWRDVAMILDEDEATLRKRFERTKRKLRELAIAEGLLR